MKFNPVEMSSAAVTSTRPLPLTAKFGSVVKKKKKAPECLEFPHSFMLLRSSLDAASADPQSW